MPGAATLRDCKILESMVNKQAADGRFYTAVSAAPAVVLGSWGLLKGKKILVPVADGSEEMEATKITDILRQAKAEVVVASVEEKLEIVATRKVKLVATRKVKLVADVFLDDALNSSYDLIVLPGKKATAFPQMCDKLSDQSEIENVVVVDGNLITSRGPGTSMEFALAIVEKFFGREKAPELSKTMLVVNA